ncbi:MAG: hypothetical protein ACK55I_20675, partial [bacterium]
VNGRPQGNPGDHFHHIFALHRIQRATGGEEQQQHGWMGAGCTAVGGGQLGNSQWFQNSGGR